MNILRVKDKYGVKQLAYEMNYEYMTEVFAGLRHRFGPPLGATVDIYRRVCEVNGLPFYGSKNHEGNANAS